MIAPEAMQAAQAHALRDYPREACGLVVRTPSGERYIACRNVATTPSEHFILPAEDYAAAEDQGEIAAVLHSHPDASARASDADRVGCETSGVPWGIVSVGREGVHDTQWIAPSGWRAPLVGRQFAFGVLDCYSLIRDCYRYPEQLLAEVGVAAWPFAPIDLPDYPREDKHWERGRSLYLELFEDAGFRRIGGELQVGDVLIMQVRAKVPNHAGVYLGDGVFLHHLYNRLSTRDVFGGYWQDSLRLAVRYGA